MDSGKRRPKSFATNYRHYGIFLALQHHQLLPHSRVTWASNRKVYSPGHAHADDAGDARARVNTDAQFDAAVGENVGLKHLGGFAQFQRHFGDLQQQQLGGSRAAASSAGEFIDVNISLNHRPDDAINLHFYFHNNMLELW